MLNGNFLALDLRVPSTLTHRPRSFSSNSRRRSANSSSCKVISSLSTDQGSSILRRPSDRCSIIRGGGSNEATTSGGFISSLEAELETFLNLLPPRMRSVLRCHSEVGDLVEVVMDLGRKPLARFPSGDWIISQDPVLIGDLEHAVSMVIILIFLFNFSPRTFSLWFTAWECIS